MAHRVELIKDDDYVCVVLTGDLTRAGAEASRDAVVSAIEESGYSRILADASEAISRASQADDFEFTASLGRFLPSAARVAVVYDPRQASTFSFVEDVAVNRDLDFRIFTDRATALEWLLRK